jgi:hypothetical protein
MKCGIQKNFWLDDNYVLEKVGVMCALLVLYTADKSLAQPTSWCILCDVENILFDASLDIYINRTNIPPIMIINRNNENQNLLSL